MSIDSGSRVTDLCYTIDVRVCSSRCSDSKPSAVVDVVLLAGIKSA